MKIMWLFIGIILILSSLVLLTLGLGVINFPIGILLFFVALFVLGYIYRKIKNREK